MEAMKNLITKIRRYLILKLASNDMEVMTHKNNKKVVFKNLANKVNINIDEKAKIKWCRTKMISKNKIEKIICVDDVVHKSITRTAELCTKHFGKNIKAKDVAKVLALYEQAKKEMLLDEIEKESKEYDECFGEVKKLKLKYINKVMNLVEKIQNTKKLFDDLERTRFDK
jgi:hypothetical protein